MEPSHVMLGIFSDVPQVEFFIDIERNNADVDSYFRFDWAATYRAETPDQGDTICWHENGLEIPADLKPSEVCYVNETSSGFLQILSTEGLAAGKTVNEVSVYSIFPNKRFQFRYSPEITMYSINRSAFDFWQQIINQNENAGGLFDPALSPINGNIQGVNESSGRVIGVFEVASVTKRRSFFGSSIVKVNMIGYENDCVIPILERCCGAEPTITPRPLYCCDCTLLPNCSNVKPDFW